MSTITLELVVARPTETKVSSLTQNCVRTGDMSSKLAQFLQCCPLTFCATFLPVPKDPHQKERTSSKERKIT